MDVETTQRELGEAKRQARRLSEGLSEEQWHWQPASGGWSIAQCLVHLNRNAELYLPRLRQAIDDAKPDGIFNVLFGGDYRFTNAFLAAGGVPAGPRGGRRFGVRAGGVGLRLLPSGGLGGGVERCVHRANQTGRGRKRIGCRSNHAISPPAITSSARRHPVRFLSITISSGRFHKE